MSVLSITDYYRRNLPHIAARERPLFITFGTFRRWRLPPGARSIALRHVIYSHCSHYFVHVAVVMPDHVHIVMTLPHGLSDDARSLAGVMKGIKGISARRINQLRKSTETVWLTESYDHLVRRAEGLQNVCEYVLQNPVRAGLVTAIDDYPWIWRAWVEGRGCM